MIWRTFWPQGRGGFSLAAPFRRSAHGNSRAKIRPSPALSPTLPAGKRTPPRCWPAENTPAECAPICRCRCSLSRPRRNAAQRPARPGTTGARFRRGSTPAPRHFHRLFAARPLQPPQPERVIALLITRQARPASSATLFGTPWRCRYAGEAHRMRWLSASLRAIRLGAISSPMRISRSNPSLTRSTNRSDTSSRSSSCGYSAPAPTAPGPRSAGRSRSC